MKIEVSNGEILDKLTILYLKAAFINDKDKLVNVRKEIEELRPIAQDLFQEYGEELRKLYDQLGEVNHQLWRFEDDIRHYEKEKDFGKSFVSTARAVYYTNDRRSDYKKEINILTNSGLVEEKSYEKYDDSRGE